MARRPPADLNIVASFYKRWAPHEDRRREIADDHKEMFAEAKANGLNPKSLRRAFAEQYRVENQTTDQAEKRAANDVDFELYLSALARVREDDDQDEPEHDADGVIIEDDETGRHGAGGAEDQVQVATVRASSSAQPLQQDSAEVARGAHNPEVAGSIPAPATTSEPASPPSEIAEPGDRGAVVPSAAPVVEPFVAVYAEPGVVVVERCPPEGIVAHPFAACWPVNPIDVSKGVREPIVKIGKLILDGRGRYFAAREEGVEYPVVQYDGTDPLLDCIRWNLASRKPSEQQRRLIAQKLAKLEPSRADDIMRAFDRHLEVAE